MRTIESNDILKIFSSLPYDKKKEVYDFTQFLLKREISEKVREKGLIERVYGSTKGSKLTTDIFSKMKAEEIGLRGILG